MPGRYFYSRLPDWGAPPVGLDAFRHLAAQAFREVLRDVLSRGSAGQKPSAYTGKSGAGAGAAAFGASGSAARGWLCAEHHGALSQPPHAAAGAAGIAYALWHAHRQTATLTAVASEEELLSSAEQYARAALAGTARQAPGEHYGWSLLAGHAGVYATAALVFDASADLAEKQGRQARAAGLRQELQQWVQQYSTMSRLACSGACQEDEVGPATKSAASLCCTCRHDRQFHSSGNLIGAPHPPPFPLSSPPACAAPLQVLYGRSGYLLGCLLLNSQLQPGSVPQEAMQSVVEAIIASGEPCCLPQALPHLWPSLPTASRSCITCAALEEPKERCAGRSLAVHLRSPATFPTPLFYLWPPGPDASPYLGAAHGLMGEPACQCAAALLSCPAVPQAAGVPLAPPAAPARSSTSGMPSHTWGQPTA